MENLKNNASVESNQLPTQRKKWSTPEFYLLDGGSVQSGDVGGGKEWQPTSAFLYQYQLIFSGTAIAFPRVSSNSFAKSGLRILLAFDQAISFNFF